LLAETDALTSCISQSSCDRAIDTEEEGYFETWHLYADETSTVVLDADSEFDNLMQLALITEVTAQSVDAKVLVANDDRSADDPRAQIAATFEATQDYLLRLSSFGDEETGCYTIRTIRVGPDDPLPEPPDTGSLAVMVSSTGAAPATYTVTLNDAKAKSVAANGTAMYEGIVTGDYAVELSGLGDCTVNEANPQNATVNANQTTSVSLAVSCPVGECDNEPEDTACGTGGVCDGNGNCVECNDASQCDQDTNQCTMAACDGNLCGQTLVMDGMACDFDSIRAGICMSGVCVEAPQCPPPCDDMNECTSDQCVAGACQFNPDVDCSDTNQCTIDDTCNPQNGNCEGGGNEPVGTPCDQFGGTVCDGAGNCINPSRQIQDAIDALPGSGLNLPIQGAWVTYVKPDDGTDPAGFFLQRDRLGPALFVAVNPASLNPMPAVGDEVALTLTATEVVNALPRGLSLTDWSRVGSGKPVDTLIQNLSGATDVVTALDSYNSELITAGGTIWGGPASSGEMHETWWIATQGLPDNESNLRVRLPLNVSGQVSIGCSVEVNATPMWRYFAEAQFCAWRDDDHVTVSCPQ
jgi:hypothetical protein